MADNLLPHHPLQEEESKSNGTDNDKPLSEKQQECQDKNEASISGSSFTTTPTKTTYNNNNSPLKSSIFKDIGRGKLYNSPQTKKGPSFGNKSNFQFHQIPLPPIGRRGSRSREPLRGQQGHNNNPFLERFRSQTSIPDSVNYSPRPIIRNGSCGNVITSPIDVFPPPSPCSVKSSYTSHSHGSTGSFLQNQGQVNAANSGSYYRPSKPKKWFSFTNLLNKQNLSSLLNLPKSGLSVSSTLNSVFVGGNSPSPSSESGGGNVFFGIGGHPNFTSFDKSGGGIQNEGFSPTFSPAHSLQEAQVVFRRKSAGPRCERSGSTNSSIGGAVIGHIPATNSTKHYSFGNSETASERSSGAGYYTGHSSTASSTVGGPVGFFSGAGTGPGSSGGGSNRLSCGEFFTGTPNSPIFSGDREAEFQCFKEGHSLSGFSSRNGESSSYSRDFYHFHKTLGRSLPTLLESMESGIASQGSSEGGQYSYTVDSVLDLMYQEFAILTGAKSIDDHYILTFPDRGNFHLLGDDDYKRLMIYLTAVPPMHDSESGFVIIVDRRNDKWNSVKTTLVRISNYFPGLIHRVFVLRPVGIFQKALSEISSKLFRTENLRFRLTVCNNITDLFAFVDPSQLTNDLGGSLYYDKVKWVQQRVEVEAFHVALQNLSRDLKSFTEVFHDLEYPNDVASTEVLIYDKHTEYQKLRSDLSQAIEHGEHLLFRIKDMCSHTPEHMNGVGNGRAKNNQKGSKYTPRLNSSVQLINVISVERYIIQIEETTRLFEEFWIKEKMSLEQCLQLRRFEQDFREMQATFDAGMKRLDELGELGESLSATDCLIAETLIFEIASADDVSRAQELEKIGKEIVESNQSAVDTVEPKCLELSRMTSQFQILLKDKISKQNEWREIQSVIERANQLCNEGMDLMTFQISEQSVEDCTDSGSCGTAIISRIDEFLDKIRDIGKELSSFKTTLGSPTHSQQKPLIKQVLKRVEDVEMMCIKRKAQIAQQITKMAKSRRSSGSSFASTPSTSSQNSYGPELKPAKSTSQLDSNMEDYSSPTSLRSGSSTLSLDGNSYNGPKINRQDGDWEVNKIKRGHVLNELLQTERTYVEEIGEILMEYRDQLNNPEVRSILPMQLQPIITPTKLQRRNPNIAVLFCNLDEIHAFQSKLFLPDLSNCVESVELVGLCFIQRHSEFLSMYSQYCQLLPASEALRKEIGENHPWFVACRNRLGHKLPLGAYLLKPVQRITKYHLLLKDLVKTSEGCEGYAELVEALECMLVVLRCVNDGMHQLGITGYPGKLIEEGYLLLQGSFVLWTDNKKDRLRLKGHQRHLFLYQRSILICKKVPKSTLYEFRNKLSLSEVGLTEAMKGSGASKKFEIWINGRQKVFLIQAENSETKEIWVREIKKLLLEQLESIRAKKSQTIAACGVGASLSSNLQPIASARRQKMMNKGVTMNGWRSANIGHRALRQVSSWDNPEVMGRPKSRLTDCEIDEDMWSSEVSNSDDDDSTATPPSRPLSMGEEPQSISVYGIGENVENSPKYIVLADYGALGPAEVSLKERDIVTVVKVGCGGWWFVKILHTSAASLGGNLEGWAPSAYLEKFKGMMSNKQSSSSLVNTEIPFLSRANIIEDRDRKQFLNPGQNNQRSTSIPGPGTSQACSPMNSNITGQKLSQSTEDILAALR